MNQVTAGIYPFFLLGLRRIPERAKTLARASFIVSFVMVSIPVLLVAASKIPSLMTALDITTGSLTMSGWYVSIAGCFYLACFLIPYTVAGASDLYFSVDWRANSILLVSPLTSRSLFWGKFALLFTVGLPVAGSLVIPAASLFIWFTPAMVTFIQFVLFGLIIYLISTIFVCGFSKRWEAAIFWILLIPLAGFLKVMFTGGGRVINYVLGYIHSSLSPAWYKSLFPANIPEINLPLWAWVLGITVGTFVFLISKGARELENMRTGKIPLGRLTKQSTEEHRKRKEYTWYRPEYVKIKQDVAASRQIFIPAESAMYRRTATDGLFDFIVNISFFGKARLLNLISLTTESINENPLYARHTARFRGYLAGIYEPSGMYKSKIVMYAMFGVPIFIWMLAVFYSTAFDVGIILVMSVGICLVLFMQGDSIVKLLREHRTKMAWESVIISPISGVELVKGTFGQLLVTKFIPNAVISIWILVASLLKWDYDFLLRFWTILLLLIFVHAWHYAGLAYMSGLSFFPASRTWFSFLAGAGVLFQVLPMAFLKYFVDILSIYSGLIVRKSFPVNVYAIEIFIASIVLIVFGLIFLQIFGRVFDKFARVPFDRDLEEGE